MAVAAAWLLRSTDLPDAVVVSVGWFAAVNLALAAFNVLPGAPLDGGRVVRAVRWSQHGSRYRAMREAAYVGGILGWGLLALGVSFTLSGRSGVWMIVSGLFVVMSARVEVFTATIGERIGPAKVNEFTWFGVAEVGPDMDVDSMIWQRSRLGGAGAVAVRGEGGSLDGLVLEDQLWAVPAERRAWTMLTSLMAPARSAPPRRRRRRPRRRAAAGPPAATGDHRVARRAVARRRAAEGRARADRAAWRAVRLRLLT